MREPGLHLICCPNDKAITRNYQNELISKKYFIATFPVSAAGYPCSRNHGSLNKLHAIHQLWHTANKMAAQFKSSGAWWTGLDAKEGERHSINVLVKLGLAKIP
jgi:hypothetical protein